MEANSNPQPINLNEVRLKRFNLNERLGKVVPFSSKSAIPDTRFDWQFYVQYYEDLQTVSTYQEAYEHWLLFGEIEGRIPNQAALENYLEEKRNELPPDFDSEGYWALNPDIRGNTSDKYWRCRAAEHFLRHGRYENRAYRSNFDWEFYIGFYTLSDLSHHIEAYDHWLRVGTREGWFSSLSDLVNSIETRQLELPEDFNHETYLELNADLQQKFHNSQYRKYQAIDHFLRLGKFERRPYGYLYHQHQRQKLKQVRKSSQIRKPDLLLVTTQADAYDCWLRHNTPNAAGLRSMRIASQVLKYQPLISIIVPTYNTPEVFLREAIESVLAQVYPYWELCIADDASTNLYVKKILEEYKNKDHRIKVCFRKKNGHISAASNSALSLATGEFVALLDHDDVLSPDALYEVALLLNQHPDADMIYSDEDKLSSNGKRCDPFFKPDWCPDSFLSRMYTCHLGVYRRSALSKIGGFRTGFEGSQDYDLVLRLVEQTNRIYHLPKVLYHWRVHELSVTSGDQAKPYAYEAAKQAISEAIHRRGESAIVLDVPNFRGHYAVRYKIKDYKLVSIIIPTRDMSSILDTCLESIFSRSSYPNYEVIVVDNGSREEETFEIFNKWSARQPKRFKHYRYDIPFNYSTLNNCGASRASGDYLLFLNNDTEVITPDWIDAMVEQAQRQSVGAIGALLLYPDHTIQHAGVVVGLGGLAAHGHQHFPADTPGYVGQVISTSNVSAVTGACLMCRRDVFEQIDGFDEKLAVAYNDIDLCLKTANAGYQNLYLPHVKLYHHESKSRGYENTPEKRARWRREADLFTKRWHKFIEHDPCYSPNLTRSKADYSIRNSGISVEVTDIKLFTSSSSTILGFKIDSPQTHSSLDAGNFSIAGWIVGKLSPAISIQIECDDYLLHTIPVDQSRPDVARVYPDVYYAKESGFLTKLELISNSAREYQLLLSATLQDYSQVQLGIMKLRVEIGRE
jgi:O-antigen biosynthesis protein